MTYLAVFAGGALGSLARGLLVPLLPAGGPITSTLLVNVLACLLLGALEGARHRVPARAMHFAAVGFCGGLSTFSSFAADIARLGGGSDDAGGVLADGFDPLAGATLEIAFGLGAAALGLVLGRACSGSATS